jgi:hypothetical protein
MEQEISKKMMDSQNAQLAGPHPHLKLRRVASLAVFFGLIAVLGLVGLHAPRAAASDTTLTLTPPQIPVPASYFNLNILFYPAHEIAWPSVPFYGWRAWHALWFDLEPQKGQWKWNHLDELVGKAQQHNSELMLILSYSPGWASRNPGQDGDWKPGTVGPVNDMNDWRDYVRAVGTRYKGKIHVYEMWNEPDRPRAWAGDMDTMVQMVKEGAQILKSIDPTVTIVSPSATFPRGPGWLDQFLAKGGGDAVDVIGYHFYTGNMNKMGPPEAVVPIIQNIQSIMAKYNVRKPLWNTEAGWLGSPFFADDQQVAFITRAVVLNWAAGISRYYYYAWDNHHDTLIQTSLPDNQTVTPAGTAYGTIESWMSGWVLHKCLTSANNNWVCELQQNGKSRFIVWNTQGEVPFRLADNWKISQALHLDGSTEPISNGSVRISTKPTLLQ